MRLLKTIVFILCVICFLLLPLLSQAPEKGTGDKKTVKAAKTAVVKPADGTSLNKKTDNMKTQKKPAKAAAQKKTVQKKTVRKTAAKLQKDAKKTGMNKNAKKGSTAKKKTVQKKARKKKKVQSKTKTGKKMKRIKTGKKNRKKNSGKASKKNAKKVSAKRSKVRSVKPKPVQKRVVYPEVVKGKRIVVKPLVINLGTESSRKYLKHWDELAAERDVYEVSRKNGLVMVDDLGPVINKRAVFIHPHGSVVSVSGLKRGVRYYLFVDFVKFRSIDVEQFPFPLQLVFSDTNGKLTKMVEVSPGELARDSLWRISIPYEISIGGQVTITFREQVPGAGIWGVWDMIIYSEKELPAQLSTFPVKPQKMRPTERLQK